MAKGIRQFIILASMGFVFFGCSSGPDEKIESFMKCAIAAEYFGDNNSVKSVDEKMKRFLLENEDYFKYISSFAEYMMKRRSEVDQELELYRYNRKGKKQILSRVYSSSKCGELYE